MCLVVFALDQHPDYPLVLLSNRDETLSRESHAPEVRSDVLAAWDTSGGGTWLGVNVKTGQFVTLTNYGGEESGDGKPSRGAAVVEMLHQPPVVGSGGGGGGGCDDDDDAAVVAQQQQWQAYAGFNLVWGRVSDAHPVLAVSSNRQAAQDAQRVRVFRTGIASVSNGHFLDAWPKRTTAEAALKDALATAERHADPDAADAVLREADRLIPVMTSVQTDVLDGRSGPRYSVLPTELLRRLSSVFVQADAWDYGTREQTILLKSRTGITHYLYRRVRPDITPWHLESVSSGRHPSAQLQPEMAATAAAWHALKPWIADQAGSLLGDTELGDAMQRWWLDLAVRYDEPHRAYHTHQHVQEMLRLVAQHRQHLRQPEAVMLAVFFHDAVYRIGNGKANETDSAELWREFACDARLPAGLVDCVSGWIINTIAHTQRNPDDDSQDRDFFLDFDLAILGAEPERYDQYAKQIRQEYHAVPAGRFAAGRSKILQGFRDTPRLFHTDVMHALLHGRAMQNLDRELASLAASLQDQTDSSAT